MSEQLGVFKTNLEGFAQFADACTLRGAGPMLTLSCPSLRKYKKDISKMPELRRDFHRMCGQIGVDPLACLYLLSRHSHMRS